MDTDPVELAVAALAAAEVVVDVSPLDCLRLHDLPTTLRADLAGEDAAVAGNLDLNVFKTEYFLGGYVEDIEAVPPV